MKEQPKRSILLVDDSKTMLHVLEVYLAGSGFEFVVCTDASEALDIARTEQPSLIISDVKMPGLSGFDLVRAVRKSSVIGPLPILLVSSDGDEAIRQKVLDCGADAFLGKPLDPQTLNDLVRALTS